MAIVKVDTTSGNPNHYPAGSSKGGQFAPATGNVDSEATSQDTSNEKSPTKGFIYVDLDDEETIDFINTNAKLKPHYDALPENDKPSFVQKVKEKLAKRQLEKVLTEKFAESNINDFTAFHEDCIAELQAKGSLKSDITGKVYTADELVRAADSMCGSPMSFEYQKYCRLGREKMKEINGTKFSDSDYDRMEEWKDKMHTLTQNWKTPKDLRVYRLLNTDYLYANFKEALDGFSTYDYHGYQKLQGSAGTRNLSKEDIQELANRFQKYIGVAVDGDGGCPSFGMDVNSSHMAKHVSEDKQRQVQILFDCPEGTNMYVTDYYYETEGYMADGMSYFIKDAYPTTRKVHFDTSYKGPEGDYEIDTLVLVYGLK